MMDRTILGLVAAVLVAVGLVFVLEMAGHMMFPPPADLNVRDPAQMATMIERLPIGAVLAVLVAWTLGAFGGGFVAAMVARRGAWPAWVVAGLLLVFSAMTMVMIPHPTWFMVAAVVLIAAAGWLAGRLGGKVAA